MPRRDQRIILSILKKLCYRSCSFILFYSDPKRAEEARGTTIPLVRYLCRSQICPTTHHAAKDKESTPRRDEATLSCTLILISRCFAGKGKMFPIQLRYPFLGKTLGYV